MHFFVLENFNFSNYSPGMWFSLWSNAWIDFKTSISKIVSFFVNSFKIKYLLTNEPMSSLRPSKQLKQSAEARARTNTLFVGPILFSFSFSNSTCEIYFKKNVYSISIMEINWINFKLLILKTSPYILQGSLDWILVIVYVLVFLLLDLKQKFI